MMWYWSLGAQFNLFNHYYAKASIDFGLVKQNFYYSQTKFNRLEFGIGYRFWTDKITQSASLGHPAGCWIINTAWLHCAKSCCVTIMGMEVFALNPKKPCSASFPGIPIPQGGTYDGITPTTIKFIFSKKHTGTINFSYFRKFHWWKKAYLRNNFANQDD